MTTKWIANHAESNYRGRSATDISAGTQGGMSSIYMELLDVLG